MCNCAYRSTTRHLYLQEKPYSQVPVHHKTPVPTPAGLKCRLPPINEGGKQQKWLKNVVYLPEKQEVNDTFVRYGPSVLSLGGKNNGAPGNL